MINRYVLICERLYNMAEPEADPEGEWVKYEDAAKLEAEVARLVGLLRDLFTNPHICLGDQVYEVRAQEGLGWDGPSVEAWSDAVTAAEAELSKHSSSNSEASIPGGK